jgi:very-short-patch-repair endonuclease
LDGSVHLKQKSYDEHRDYILSSLGMKVIRISNDKIMNNINSVIELLKNELVKT